MKVLLIQPPVTRLRGEEAKHRTPVLPPLGLMSLSAYLKRETAHTVHVLDALASYDPDSPVRKDGTVRYGMTDGDIWGVLKLNQPDVVGVTCLFSNMVEDFHNVFRLAKENDPACVTVAGGPHATTWASQTLGDPNVDYVIRHDGELAFTSLLSTLEGGNGGVRLKVGDEWCDTPVTNLTHRRDGKVCEHPAMWVADLDTLPFADRDCVFSPEHYSGIQSPHGSHYTHGVMATIICTKGCPYTCAFCSTPNVSGQTMRYRSPKHFCDEVEILYRRYGVRQLSVEDDDWNADRERFKTVLRELKSRNLPGLGWNAPNGLLMAGIDEEAADLMAETGCMSVSLGLESGNERVLRRIIRKPVKLEWVRPRVRLLRDRGIRVMLFLIIGSIAEDPDDDESKEEIYDTWRFAANANADWYGGPHICTPLPGTDTWRRALSRMSLSDLDMRKLKYSVSNVPSPKWTKDWLERTQDLMNRHLNFAWNTNVRERNLERAKSDFSRVARLYPGAKHAHIAKSMVSEPWLPEAFFTEDELDIMDEVGIPL